MRILKSIAYKNREIFRNHIDRLHLKNKDVSIISNHCMGGIIYHDLGLQFRSPTINLKILPDDFIILVENLKEYLSLPIEEIEEKSVSYPVGRVNGSHGG